MAVLEASKTEDDSSFIFLYYPKAEPDADREGDDDQEQGAELEESPQGAVVVRIRPSRAGIFHLSALIRSALV